MLRNNNINHTKFSLVTVIGLMLAACAHQSKVTPSTGHIDSKAVTPSANQTAAAPIPKLVRSAPKLPPPKATTKAQTYSVVVNEVPVKEILFALARESKLNIDIHPSIQGRATLNAVDQTLPAILERLARQVDLTYKMEGNVLYIAPDAPVLRTYQINYVNMQRTTKGNVSVANEIASASNSTVTSAGAGGASTTSSSGSSGGSNTSSTSVESESKNYFWDSLIQNIKDILSESDKEVLVKRLGSDARLQAQYDAQTQGSGDVSVNSRGSNSTGNNSGGGVSGSGNQNVQGATNETAEKNLKEYKTLFAASVIANKETGVLSVRATGKQHESIQEFIDKVQAGARRQVLIEATIVEVRLNDSFQAGIDWSRFGNNANSSGFTFKQTLGSISASSSPGFTVGYLNPVSSLGKLAASVTLLEQFGDTKVISSPKLMVLNSQTAILKVVDNLVYFTTQAIVTPANNISAALTSFTTTPHTIPTGVWMSVTPQINENSMVTLNVRPTIAKEFGPRVQDPNPDLVGGPGSGIPQIQVREMESMLQINSGNTAVLGGLMQDDVRRNSDKVPGLSKVPVVGKAFTSKDEANIKTELVIFLRPTVITNASLESDELQSYKQYLPAQQLQNMLEDAN